MLSAAAPTSTVRALFVTTAPPMTSSPSVRVTGRDSPVTSDSSTAARPSATVPSTGTRSPARTCTRSPGARSPTATVSVAPSETRRASSTCSRVRVLSRSVARRFTRSS